LDAQTDLGETNAHNMNKNVKKVIYFFKKICPSTLIDENFLNCDAIRSLAVMIIVDVAYTPHVTGFPVTCT